MAEPTTNGTWGRIKAIEDWWQVQQERRAACAPAKTPTGSNYTDRRVVSSETLPDGSVRSVRSDGTVFTRPRSEQLEQAAALKQATRGGVRIRELENGHTQIISGKSLREGKSLSQYRVSPEGQAIPCVPSISSVMKVK
jgi:hypothetical protein